MKIDILKKIEELEKNGKVYDGSYDAVFKSVMQDKDIKDFTAFLISNTDKRKIDEEKMIFVNTEGTKNSIADRVNVHDIVIDIDNNRISLEMNRSSKKEIRDRNKAHFFEGASKAINISYRIGKDNYYEQINFDFTNIEDDIVSVYKRVNVKTGKVDDDEKNIIKYRINMAKVYKKYYTDREELTRFEKAIAILSFDKIEDLRKIAEGDEMLMRVEKKIEELSKNPDLVRYIDDEAAMRFGHQKDIEDAVEKATKEVTKEVKKKKTIEIAKKMLDENADISFISKVTGLSENSIKNLF